MRRGETGGLTNPVHRAENKTWANARRILRIVPRDFTVTSLILDESTTAKFEKVGGRIELRDPEGRTIGFFEPAHPAPGWIFEEADEPCSEEELDRRSREGGGFTTAEVLAHLKTL